VVSKGGVGGHMLKPASGINLRKKPMRRNWDLGVDEEALPEVESSTTALRRDTAVTVYEA
jgi:hypothetical protein